ncbi:MAG TPA: hypothetical protein VN462_10075, partial [Negativicutes bacterium]|nr:hypothetical protein [Negativicutes bacterium]
VPGLTLFCRHILSTAQGQHLAAVYALSEAKGVITMKKAVFVSVILTMLTSTAFGAAALPAGSGGL